MSDITIWKFNLDLAKLDGRSSLSIQMPKESCLLSVAFQGEALYLWAVVSPSAELCERRVAIIGTGHSMHPEVVAGIFVGTAIFRGAPLVFHVFDLGY